MEGSALDQGLDIIPGLFRFLCGPPATWESVQAQCKISDALSFCIDAEMVYEPFYGDFGPLNLGHTYNFCMQANALVEEAIKTGSKVYFYCAPHPAQRANAAVLVGVWQVLSLGRSAEEAWDLLKGLPATEPFRDASCGPSLLPLTIQDIIQGMARAKSAGFLEWHKNPDLFDVESYLHYEQVQHGDLNWVVPGKLLAFAGPAAEVKHYWGHRSFTPEDYHGYFVESGVGAIVRLNNELYEAESFTSAGFQHHELFFPDGSCPSSDIVLKFLTIVEEEAAGLAVHCKAGLGRTGVLICCYMMKHFGFTAREAIAYIRVCRPGSVIGPQQTFLHINEAELWKHGDIYRHKKAESERKARTAERQQARDHVAALCGKGSPQSRTLVNISASGSDGSAVAWTMDVDSADDTACTAVCVSSKSSSPARARSSTAAELAQQHVPSVGARALSRSGSGAALGARIAASAIALSDFLSGSSGSTASGTGSGLSAGTTQALPGTPSRAHYGAATPACCQPGTPASRAPTGYAQYLRESPVGSVPCSPAVGSRFLAENGQPRKGMCLPASPTSKAVRGLNFSGADDGNWSIGSAHTSS